MMCRPEPGPERYLLARPWQRVRLWPLLLFALLAVTPAMAQQPALEEVMLATAPPGHRDPSAWYGHSAILAIYSDGTAHYYTYRLHWAESVPQAASSALGMSTFRLDRLDLADAIADYDQQGRGLRAMGLGLDPGVERAFIDALEAERVATRNEPLTYDAVADNCSTRIRDLVDEAMGGRLAAATQGVPAGSAWELFLPYMAHDVGTRLALEILLGPHVDEPMDAWQSLFLPERLEAEVAGLEGVGPAVQLHEAAPGIVGPPADLTPWRFAPALLGGLIAAAGHPAATRSRGPAIHAGAVAVAWAVLALPAAGIFVEWTTDLGIYWSANLNILVLSPLILAGLPVAIGSIWSTQVRPWMDELLRAQLLLGIAALLVALAPGTQAGAGLALAVLPLHVGSYVGSRWARTESTRPFGVTAPA